MLLAADSEHLEIICSRRCHEDRRARSFHVISFLILHVLLRWVRIWKIGWHVVWMKWRRQRWKKID